MTEGYRIEGGLINRDKKLTFSFNGQKKYGYQGDSLASALLASGDTIVARSFKYHRPRGIFSAGSEEPNALVHLGRGALCEPNTKATTVELYDGLEANPQNYRLSVHFDLMAINDFLSPLLTAGFYYKTFMWPKYFWEKIYEPIIRNSAGMGKLSGHSDPSHYDKGFLHCDLLIIGAGPAGLIAALEAGKAGLRVILADEDFLPGGRLNSETYQIDQKPATLWIEETVEQLRNMPNIRLMTRMTVYGCYDHGIYGAVEQIAPEVLEKSKPRQILWRIYSKRALLCAGAIERSIAFGNNDRPAIMLAGAVRAYVNRWAVAPGKAIGIFTNNDDGWQTARDLRAKNIPVSALIDTRRDASDEEIDGVEIIRGERITDCMGRKRLRAVKLTNGRLIAMDTLAVSGGWNPNIHLTCHQGAKAVWDEKISAFLPARLAGLSVAGSANGTFALGDVLKEAYQAAQKIAKDLDFTPRAGKPPQANNEAYSLSPLWHVKESRKRAWVDLQNDVTYKDIALAHQEGFRSVEHLKRYTTLGMGTDQGKNSNVIGLALMAEQRGLPIEKIGTTSFRPPYTPVSIGAFGGRSRGKNFRPYRLTPSHQWAEERNAVFVETGQWLRAQWFPLASETHWRQSVDREVTMIRASVGICDVTTLGKIDIQGRDSAPFLNRVYANGFAKLPVGKVRYGLMLREDGISMDDGTTARLAENHFVMTTTTANAGTVFRHLEFCRQCLWPNDDVHLISTTDGWAQYAVAGPNARKLLQNGIVDKIFDISNDAFPFMGCANITVCNGVLARLFRISFSGELAYEIAVPTRYGNSLVRALMEAGKNFDVTPYGTEALGVMRIEKGHPAGNELNGRTTARHLGMEKMVSKKKDCIGNVLSERPYLNRENDYRLMGFKPVDRKEILSTAGSHFIAIGDTPNMDNDQGWMSSVAFSPTLGHSIGLGFILGGEQRIGETVRAFDPVHSKDIPVEIVSPHFIDPEGKRMRA